MCFPCKWRETIDPFSLKFTNFKLKEILVILMLAMMCFMQEVFIIAKKLKYLLR